MLKRVALLGAIAALTIGNPSNSVAQGWDGGGGCCGITVTVTGFPRPDFCCERRFFPRRVFCCERRFFPRRDICCERRFFPRPVFCCEPERRFFPRPAFCCEPERRFFARPFDRPPYYYGDSFAPYAYNWNRYDAGYSEAGYGYGSDEY
jgi:hypothetical protein